MVLNVAFAKRSRWNNWNLVGRISGTRHPAFYQRHQLPDGGFALSGLPKRSSSDTVLAFTCGITAAVLTPAEIGEPKRE
jgi:hypothetical protein